MRHLRDAPPRMLGGRVVHRMDDLTAGGEGLPATDGLRYLLVGQGRVVIRPSGTEPKLKCYLEVVEPVGADSDLARARKRARVTVDAIKADLAGALGVPTGS